MGFTDVVMCRDRDRDATQEFPSNRLSLLGLFYRTTVLFWAFLVIIFSSE